MLSNQKPPKIKIGLELRACIGSCLRWSQFCASNSRFKYLIMDLKASIKYGSGFASFEIRRESPGVYHAALVYFDGDEKKAPPPEITLVRGIRQWTGSLDDSDLLNELGRIIEESYHNSSTVNMYK